MEEQEDIPREMLSEPRMDGVRLAAYLRLCEELVPDTILSQFMHETATSMAHYWSVRERFTKQLALSNFLCYLLSVEKRNPNRVVFRVDSGASRARLFSFSFSLPACVSELLYPSL